MTDIGVGYSASQSISLYVEERLYTYECNIEARSRNRCCSGKTISITYSECVSVALVIQHARITCGLSGGTEFFHIIS